MRTGDTTLWVSTTDLRGAPWVVVSSAFGAGMDVTEELSHFMATESTRLVIGQLELRQEPVPTLRVSHTILGLNLTKAKVRAVVDEVVRLSREYGAIVRDRFGGTSLEAAAEAFAEAIWGQRQPHGTIELVQTPRWLWNLGVVLGILGAAAAGFLAYAFTSSIALTIYAVLWTFFVVRFGSAKFGPGERRVARLFRFLVTPIASVGVLVAMQVLFGRWWLSALVAGAAALAFAWFLPGWLFPKLSAQLEASQTKKRSGEA